jgi:hypothetical protein
MKEFSHPGIRGKGARSTSIVPSRTPSPSPATSGSTSPRSSLGSRPELPAVPCVASEFNQVILNLIVNAAHAIADANSKDTSVKGRITIATRRAGDRGREIAVQDTGTGIRRSEPSTHLRPVLHHQSRRSRHWPGPGYRSLRRRRQASGAPSSSIPNWARAPPSSSACRSPTRRPPEPA